VASESEVGTPEITPVVESKLKPAGKSGVIIQLVLTPPEFVGRIWPIELKIVTEYVACGYSILGGVPGVATIEINIVALSLPPAPVPVMVYNVAVDTAVAVPEIAPVDVLKLSDAGSAGLIE
jgi:hypothetical protein